jgi:hypothetical protein
MSLDAHGVTGLHHPLHDHVRVRQPGLEGAPELLMISHTHRSGRCHGDAVRIETSGCPFKVASCKAVVVHRRRLKRCSHLPLLERRDGPPRIVTKLRG